MTSDIEDRVVVLTGASSGIARAAALAFAGRGARVVVAARDPVALDQVVADRAAPPARSVPRHRTAEP